MKPMLAFFIFTLLIIELFGWLILTCKLWTQRRIRTCLFLFILCAGQFIEPLVRMISSFYAEAKPVFPEAVLMMYAGALGASTLALWIFVAYIFGLLPDKKDHGSGTS